MSKNYKLAIFIGLQRLSSLYEGTVFGEEKAKRRAKSKLARKARRLNR